MKNTKSLSLEVLGSSLRGDYCARSGLVEKFAFSVIYTADLAAARKHYLSALPKAKVKFETEEMVSLEVDAAGGPASIVLQKVAPKSPFGKLIGKQSVGMTVSKRSLSAKMRTMNLIDMTSTLGWDQKVMGLKDPEGNVMLIVEASTLG